MFNQGIVKITSGNFVVSAANAQFQRQIYQSKIPAAEKVHTRKF